MTHITYQPMLFNPANTFQIRHNPLLEKLIDLLQKLNFSQIFFNRTTLNNSEKNLLIEYYTRNNTSLEKIVPHLLKSYEFSKQQANTIVKTVKDYHAQNASKLNHLEKADQLKHLCDGWYNTKDGTWAHSVFIDLIEDWIDCNTPELDGAKFGDAVTEIYGPSSTITAPAA